MIKELRKASLDKYKSNKANSWVIGLLCGLFIASVLGLNVVIDGINVLTIPLIILPFFFAIFMDRLGLMFGQRLTLSLHFKHMFNYFGYPFSGCFRALINLAKAILVFVISVSILSSVMTLYLKINNPSNYESIINEINSLLQLDDILDRDLTDVLTFKSSEISLFFFVIYTPSILLSAFYFIYRTCYEAISIYIRLALIKAKNNFLKMVVRKAISSNRKSLRKDFIFLNWPLFLLMLIGMVMGVIISINFISYNIMSITSFSIAIGFVFASFYFPFYFNNMETLYDKYEKKFQLSSIEVTKQILRNIQSNIDLSEEEQKEVTDSLNKMLDDNKDNEEEKRD